jgi:hypothetical protein
MLPSTSTMGSEKHLFDPSHEDSKLHPEVDEMRVWRRQKMHPSLHGASEEYFAVIWIDLQASPFGLESAGLQRQFVDPEPPHSMLDKPRDKEHAQPS